MAQTITGIEEYKQKFEGLPLERLQEMLEFLTGLLPESELVMSYGVPTFRVAGKNLVHTATYKNHLGFYPGASGMRAFATEFSAYKTGPGSVQFPHKTALPLELIRKICQFRLKELKEKSS